MTLGENTRLVAQRLGTAVEQINKTRPPVEDFIQTDAP
jgi:cobalt-zinc-cadmium resistance protein CzcA